MPLAPPPRKGASLQDDDDDGWQDMPVVRHEEFVSDLDAVDREKYGYVQNTKGASQAQGNATGNLIDFDDRGNEWRAKTDTLDESEYTRLKLDEDEDGDDVHLRTKYLFDEDKAMTPLSQMQQTKNMLTDAQRIAYVGVCALVAREMIHELKIVGTKELKPAIQQMELWALKIMGRLYYHMELETQEQKMIESLAEHGVQATDLVPSLMTTHTVANPEYDPVQAKEKADRDAVADSQTLTIDSDNDDTTIVGTPTTPQTASKQHALAGLAPPVLPQTEQQTLPGVSTTLDATDENVTLDIRWTVLCDLFLIIIADSVYDSRSRVLLERVASKLGLGWLDVVKFEKRVTDALEIQEGVEKMEQQDVIDGRIKAGKRRRYAMMGIATLGGGLVIGLSAGLLAPVIGAALGGFLTTVGIGGTTGFLAGAGGAALITTGGTLAGSGIAVKGMARRTRAVNTFNLMPLHNNKRVNCIITVSGFMTGPRDDVRLPFSVLDPVVGDVFSVLWEPEMMGEMGNALGILTTEVLTTVGQQVLQATMMTALMSALQWPLILTKLGYLIDNPWSNALDRARAAGLVLADVLIQRHLGVRPITLIGFSLGARVIFYCLVELAKHKALGVVQDVFICGTTVTAPTRTWHEVRSVVAGRFVNGYSRRDWVLNYLFRATSGGLNTVAGLRPVEGVPGLENVDLTDKIAGHTSYRTYMPVILHQLGFPVTADFFDEPEEPDMEGDRVVIREEEEQEQKKGFRLFGRKSKPKAKQQSISRPPSAASFPSWRGAKGNVAASSSGGSLAASSSAGSVASATAAAVAVVPEDDELPAREAHPVAGSSAAATTATAPSTPIATPAAEEPPPTPKVPLRAGFDFGAIHNMLDNEREERPVPSSSGIPLDSPQKLAADTLERAQSSIYPADEASDDITTGFSRQLKLEPGRRASWSHSSADADDDDGPETARPAAISFADTDGTIWPAPSTTEPRWGSSGSGSSTTAAPSDPYAQRNPFAASTLSFGGVDGTITTSTTLDTSVPKKTTAWTPSNPWG
ncbi:DUF726-domain-containing protein [Auricularia subglabra TFB-10046 SS5]|nr:DUF726-domain-containing protein [Auricularia subglabra TFB-10046 SS5]